MTNYVYMYVIELNTDVLELSLLSEITLDLSFLKWAQSQIDCMDP